MAEDSDIEEVLTEPLLNPALVQKAATFVRNEAPSVHPIFGGLPHPPDKEVFQFPTHLNAHLALALRDYVRTAFRIDISTDAPNIQWDKLFDDINNLEENAHGTGHGPRAIFSKLILKISENQDVIDPWISLIPNEYGLSVIKCGIAVALNAVKRYADERKKLFEALAEIRDMIVEANSKTKSFQQEPEISKYAGLLHEAIATAIENILQSLPSQETPAETKRSLKGHLTHAGRHLVPNREKSKEIASADETSGQNKAAEERNGGRGGTKTNRQVRKQKRSKINIDDILSNARAAAKSLNYAVDEWKTRTLQATEQQSKDTNEKVAVIFSWVESEAHPTIKDTNAKVNQIHTGLIGIEYQRMKDAKRHNEKQDETNQLVKELNTNFAMLLARDTANNALFDMGLEELKKYFRDFEKRLLAMENQSMRDRKGNASRVETPRAFMTLGRLLKVLFNLSFGQGRPSELIADVGSMLKHLTDGIDTVIRRRTRITVQDQDQAQAVFEETRLRAWLEIERSDMILVDGNMQSSARDRISAMSLFCANFVMTMAKLEPRNVFTYFFCGLYTTWMDPGAGPRDILQSLIIQLLVALDDQNALSLEFLSKQHHVQELKEGNINRLCRVLYELVNEFPRETTVYCIIDGIQFFDRDACQSNLDLLVRNLEAMSRDDDLQPKFKILIAAAFRSSAQLKNMVEEKRYIRLTARHLGRHQMSARVFEERLDPRSSQSRQRRSREAWEERRSESSNSEFGSDSDESTDYGE